MEPRFSLVPTVSLLQSNLVRKDDTVCWYQMNSNDMKERKSCRFWLGKTTLLQPWRVDNVGSWLHPLRQRTLRLSCQLPGDRFSEVPLRTWNGPIWPPHFGGRFAVKAGAWVCWMCSAGCVLGIQHVHGYNDLYWSYQVLPCLYTCSWTRSWRRS